MNEGGTVLDHVTPEALYAALEEVPYPTVRTLQERFGLRQTAYTVLDAHYSVRYVLAFRPEDGEARDLRLALLGDAVRAACDEASAG